MFYCLDVHLSTFKIKVDLCAHTDSKNGIFTRRVYMGYILTRTPPPPFAQVDGGGCYREKFFYFSDCRFMLVDYDLDLLHVVENYGFDIISRFYIPDSKFLLVFYFFIFSTRFYSHQFRLVSALLILCFNSSNLYLFCLL